ncbi:hypothetical protein TNCV_4278891 [Trichonephila clavipes]|nr:hypothetical protein TNCV_4278891 [Trichonephila clavipes]
MATPGSSFTLTPLGHEDNLKVRTWVRNPEKTWMSLNVSCLRGMHGGTLNSRRAASSLGRLVEGEERWEAPDTSKVFSLQNWGGTKPNRIVTCELNEEADTKFLFSLAKRPGSRKGDPSTIGHSFCRTPHLVHKRAWSNITFALTSSLHRQSVAHPVEWLATLTAVPLGLGSNPEEDMDVCKCTVPSRHGGTLNSRRESQVFS